MFDEATFDFYPALLERGFQQRRRVAAERSRVDAFQCGDGFGDRAAIDDRATVGEVIEAAGHVAQIGTLVACVIRIAQTPRET
jgi:hypothetical protein